MPKNPYYDYSIVREQKMFFGREKLLRELYDGCLRRQCFSLVGTRQSGKSSVLAHIQDAEIQKRLGFDLHRVIFINIDMREYIQADLEDFFQTVSEQILSHVPNQITLDTAGRKGHDLFPRILQQLYRAGFHVVLLMDAFDKVEKVREFGPGFFSFLRSPSTQGWVSYITASVKPLYRIAPAEQDSPFFNGFKTCNIEPLTREEAIGLITQPTREAGISLTEHEIQWILEQAGRHPFFLQRVCYHLFEEKCRQMSAGSSSPDFERVRQEAYKELAPHFDSIWKELSTEQQREFRQETRQPPGTQCKITELSESALFRKHLGERFQIGQLDLTVENVRDALSNLDSRIFLQTCTLAEMQWVETRADGDRTVANQRGLLVQELLKLAFERMKPGGVRSDTAREWRGYNILYYHYFKQHMTNEQIAARLGISRRQFYRDLKDATLALIQELQNLDNNAFVSDLC